MHSLGGHLGAKRANARSLGEFAAMFRFMNITMTLAAASAFAFGGAPAFARDAKPTTAKGISPARCGPTDLPEPGIQGDVPAGATAAYNCGVRLVGRLPRVGNVQGAGTCAYVRSRDGQVHVVDMRDPAKPVEVGSLPVQMGSETMRVVVNGARAILVSGSTVYDVRDCLKPVLLGEIKWPSVTLPGIPSRSLPHDIRINHAGTKVYASFGLWEADITNLRDPGTWKVTDHRCELSAQISGPTGEIHRKLNGAGLSLCIDATKPSPMGANYVLGASPLQSAFIWPTFSHSPDTNGDDTRLYLADQSGGNSKFWAPSPKLRIIDLTKGAPKIIGEVDGPGHGLDWFRSGGRDYVLHSNEGGTLGIMNQTSDSDTCRPYPRPTALGWGFEVLISDVTDPKRAKNVSMLRIAINDPEFCNVRKASGRDPWLAYHLIDNPRNPRFAMVNFTTAGLRIFDLRNPAHPVEVAYYNHGNPVHGGIGHYDAARGLIYAAGSDGLWVLEFEPQVKAQLGL
jgi:hypothetical protein